MQYVKLGRPFKSLGMTPRPRGLVLWNYEKNVEEPGELANNLYNPYFNF